MNSTMSKCISAEIAKILFVEAGHRRIPDFAAESPAYDNKSLSEVNGALGDKKKLGNRPCEL